MWWARSAYAAWSVPAVNGGNRNADSSSQGVATSAGRLRAPVAGADNSLNEEASSPGKGAAADRLPGRMAEAVAVVSRAAADSSHRGAVNNAGNKHVPVADADPSSPGSRVAVVSLTADNSPGTRAANHPLPVIARKEDNNNK